MENENTPALTALRDAVKDIEIIARETAHEAYAAPNYTPLERKLLWALSTIGDNARNAINAANS